MGAQNIKFNRQVLQQQIPRKFLDRKNINKKSVSSKPLEWERSDYLFRGQNRSAQDNNFWVLLAEIIGVGVEQNPEALCCFGVVGARLCEDCVALPDEGFGKELTEVSEAKNGDFEGVGFLVMGFDLGFVVEGLSCIHGSDSEAMGMEVGVVFGELESGRR